MNGDATSNFVGNYYSQSTFIMTLIKRETCVHVGYFIQSGVFRCFYQIVYGYPGIRRFPISAIWFLK